MIDTNIFVVMSCTDTKVGKAVRAVTGTKYNHASISFDRGLEEMYAFARPYYHAPALGRLVHETPGMYTKNGFNKSVPIKVYEVPATEGQRDELRAELLSIATDTTYIYNFPSALSFPLLHGTQGERMYTCTEFVAKCIQFTSVELEEPSHTYGPCELMDELSDLCIYEGSMCRYLAMTNSCIEDAPPDFFKHVHPILLGSSMLALGVAATRTAKAILRRREA